MPVPLLIARAFPFLKYLLGPGAAGYAGAQLATGSDSQDPQPTQPMAGLGAGGSPAPQSLAAQRLRSVHGSTVGQTPEEQGQSIQLIPRNTGMNQSTVRNQSIDPSSSTMQGLGVFNPQSLLPAPSDDPSSAVKTPVQPIQASDGQLAAAPPGEGGGFGFLDFLRKILSLIANPVAHLQNFTLDDRSYKSINEARRMKHNEAKALRPELGEYEDLTPEQIKRNNIRGRGNAYQDSVDSYNPVDPKLTQLRQKQQQIDLASKEGEKEEPQWKYIERQYNGQPPPKEGEEGYDRQGYFTWYYSKILGYPNKVAREEAGKRTRDRESDLTVLMDKKNKTSGDYNTFLDRLSPQEWENLAQALHKKMTGGN